MRDLEDVARSLEASVADAPASPRMAEIRAALLEEVASVHHPAVALRALALAAVVLLAVVVAFAAPVVGSYLEQLDDASPGPVVPDRDTRADDLVTPTRSLAETEREPDSEDPAASPQPVVEEGQPAASVAPPVPPETESMPWEAPTPARPDPAAADRMPPIPVPMPPIVPAP